MIEPAYAAFGSTLTVRAWIDDTELDPISIPVVLDRSPRGAARIAGGGCYTELPGVS
jgi:hypothetical protein